MAEGDIDVGSEKVLTSILRIWVHALEDTH